jgi:ribulose-phosphate 3-epimerase
MNEIIPAIIPETFDELKDKLAQVVGISPVVHVDVIDGVFAEPVSWPYARPNDPDFGTIIREEEGMPFWEDVDFEFHLMLSDPERHVQEWVSLGAKRIIVHAEAFKDADTLRIFVERFRKEFGGDGSFLSIELGVSLNFQTPTSILESAISEIDFVQFMSIAKIGRQGAGIPFEESVISKIADFREQYSNTPVSVDGGVNRENIVSLREVGVERFVVGGAIFQSENILGTIEELESLTDNG